MTKYILDTDICSYILKRHPMSVVAKYSMATPEDMYMSVATYAELLFGAEKIQSKKISVNTIEDLVVIIKVLNWDMPAAREYSKIRDYLEKRGEMIGNMDLMIAAHARSLGMTVVTNNYKHFSKVPDLKLENWVI